jgi:hypothetical protein
MSDVNSTNKKFITVLYQFFNDEDYNKFVEDYKQSNEFGQDEKIAAISLSNKFAKADIFEEALERIAHECTGDLTDDEGNEEDIFDYIDKIFDHVNK